MISDTLFHFTIKAHHRKKTYGCALLNWCAHAPEERNCNQDPLSLVRVIEIGKGTRELHRERKVSRADTLPQLLLLPSVFPRQGSGRTSGNMCDFPVSGSE